jgi:hypothetical protein
VPDAALITHAGEEFVTRAHRRMPLTSANLDAI